MSPQSILLHIVTYLLHIKYVHYEPQKLKLSIFILYF